MPNITGQRWLTLLESTASLAAAGSTSGSAAVTGFVEVRGILFSSGSFDSASGVTIYQSADGGANWDYAELATITENSGSVYSASLHGNGVMVRLKNGADAAASLRTAWYLVPAT